MSKLGLRLGFTALPLFASLLSPADARACGGCFHPEDQPPEQQSVVVAHRMAISISPDVSVLWDQVQYAGSPAEFAWVLPVKPGARLEVASDAWFEALDAATAVRIVPPTIQCYTQTVEEAPPTDYRYYGCSTGVMAAGCAAEGAGLDAAEPQTVTEVTDLAPPEDPVTIVHQGSAGPYETVTLHSDVPGALPDWLSSHGYAIDADIQPIIDAYATEGFDFIALRLLPDKGVQQMKPVRVIQPGAVTTLPLRMVAAGAGANVDLTLFVIAEGAYEPQNFPRVAAFGPFTWDFAYQQSNWSSQREYAFTYQPNGWITTFAQPGALFSPTVDPSSATGAPVQYVTGLGPAETLADAFMDQALANGEAAIACSGIFDAIAQSTQKVVDTCPPEGGECADAAPGQLDARYFACGPIQDLANALVGMHPRDVWVTRLEARLPKDALASDLELGAAWSQIAVPNVIVASSYINPPCQVTSGYYAAANGAGDGERRRAGSVPPLVAASLIAVVAVLARRTRRASTRSPLPRPMRRGTG